MAGLQMASCYELDDLPGLYNSFVGGNDVHQYGGKRDYFALWFPTEYLNESTRILLKNDPYPVYDVPGDDDANYRNTEPVRWVVNRNGRYSGYQLTSEGAVKLWSNNQFFDPIDEQFASGSIKELGPNHEVYATTSDAFHLLDPDTGALVYSVTHDNIATSLGAASSFSVDAANFDQDGFFGLIRTNIGPFIFRISNAGAVTGVPFTGGLGVGFEAACIIDRLVVYRSEPSDPAASYLRLYDSHTGLLVGSSSGVVRDPHTVCSATIWEAIDRSTGVAQGRFFDRNYNDVTPAWYTPGPDYGFTAIGNNPGGTINQNLWSVRKANPAGGFNVTIRGETTGTTFSYAEFDFDYSAIPYSKNLWIKVDRLIQPPNPGPDVWRQTEGPLEYQMQTPSFRIYNINLLAYSLRVYAHPTSFQVSPGVRQLRANGTSILFRSVRFQT